MVRRCPEWSDSCLALEDCFGRTGTKAAWQCSSNRRARGTGAGRSAGGSRSCASPMTAEPRWAARRIPKDGTKPVDRHRRGTRRLSPGFATTGPGGSTEFGTWRGGAIAGGGRFVVRSLPCFAGPWTERFLLNRTVAGGWPSVPRVGCGARRRVEWRHRPARRSRRTVAGAVPDGAAASAPGIPRGERIGGTAERPARIAV